MARVRAEQISKIYPGTQRPVTALDGVSFSADVGEFLAVTGPSGSGKSTLMNILGCLDIPTCGQYYLDGENVSALSPAGLTRLRNQSIGFIFQDHNLIPTLTALENVELPLLYRRVPAATRKRMAAEALEQVGLGDRWHHRPGQLSGGQRQRVAIARTLATRPPLILADEPTGSLDPAAGRSVTDLLLRMAEQGHTVIVITHDPALAERAPRRIRIVDGRIDRKDETHGPEIS